MTTAVVATEIRQVESALVEASAVLTAEAGKIEQTTALVKSYVANLTGRASERAKQLRETALERATKLKQCASETASDPQVQVTAAAAVAGSAAFGTAGGTVGVAVGSVVGAAVGIVPAVFTFGLSIPVCAVAGAAVGGGAGATVGGTTGLVGGGAAGYYGYAHKDEIRKNADGVYDRVNACQSYAIDKITNTSSFLSCKLKQLQPARLSRKSGA
jgi:hypothetical protein